ncbi:MAG TPA: nucleotidyltransferase domain-containing protein [Anaerolineae bacterium]
MDKKTAIPEIYKRDIRKAVEILKAAGCTDIFLFGSLTAGRTGEGSDIDLAVRGCPQGEYFHLLGRLLLELEHLVDLINLDKQDAFARYLEQEGELLQVD